MEQSHIRSFTEARKNLVERRAALIKSLSLAHQEGQMEAHVDLMVRIQSAIGVIDTAIAEELIQIKVKTA